MRDQINKLHEQAASQYLQGEFDGAMQSWRELLTLDPADERAKEGVRLCELLAEENGMTDSAAQSQPQAAPTPAPPAPEVEAELADLENLLDGIAPPPAAPAPDQAAAELQSRVQELLVEASGVFEQGDTEGSLKLLERIFILDETHAAARALQEHIEAARPRAAESLDDLSLDEDLPELPDVPTAAPEAEPAPPAEAPAAATPAETPTPDDDDPFADVDDPIAPAEEAAAADEIDTDDDAPVPAPRVQRPGNTRLVIAGAVFLVVAIGGYFAWKFLFGDNSLPLTTPVPSTASQALAEEPADDAAPAGEAVETASVPAEEPVAVDPERLSEIMARAQAAMLAGEYAAAVVAYDEVLRLAPDHAPAQEGLEHAGEGYREQQQRLERLQSAIAHFNAGSFREALRIFYRIPEGGEQARFDRYKANAWYNLGVQALQSGNCKDARSHFDEVKSIRPADPGLAQAEMLAEACRSRSSDSNYYRDAKALALRGLED